MGKRVDSEARLASYGPDLMGDGIDPVTGALQFSHTDIDLSGNSDLTVRLSRKRSLGWRHDYLLDEEFGDWELDVPKIVRCQIN